MLLGASGMPRNSIDRLQAACAGTLNTPAIRDRLASQGVEVVGGTPEALATFLDQEIPKWNKVVKAAQR